MKKLGLSPAEIQLALAALKKQSAAAGTDGTDAAAANAQTAANGIAVPIPTQPQLALGFVANPVAIASAAAQAISALVGQGQTTADTASAATTDLASTAAANATAATANASATVAANTAATASTSDAAAAAALLAQQDVVSVTGTATTATTAQTAVAAAAANAVHTIANQSGDPVLGNASKAAGDVATAAIQQQQTGNMPMSRMQEIRAKLQAAQLGASKTSATGTTASALPASTAATIGANATQTTGNAATAGATIADLSQKFGAAVTAAQTGAQTGADKQAADAVDPNAQSADPNASVDPTLAGLTQGQTAQTDTQQQQASASSQASIPLSALSSTLVAHAKAGSSEFNIRLDPAGLGQIDVKMKVSSDGEVRAHLIVDQPATLDLMMRDRHQLQQQLDQAGFKTDPSSLQFSLKDQSQNPNQGQQQAWQDQSSKSSSTQTTDTAITPMQNAVYARQSYIRADAVDVSV